MAKDTKVERVFRNRLKTCAVCGKEFVVMNTDYWTYKVGSRYYCGWNHFSQDKYKKNKGA